MAETLCSEEVTIPFSKAKLGRQIVEVVTSGMYDDPLMILREYIQNSADAIDSTLPEPDEAGSINVVIDPATRTIIIEDNGCGISNQNAEAVLCSMAASTKSSFEARGFRGIGRLGGLGYCDEITFETRSRSSEMVTRVVWDAKKVAFYADQGGSFDLSYLISRCTDTRMIKATPDTPTNFFKVTLRGIRRFHCDDLMSVHAVTRYLSQAAPTSYDYELFPFAAEIENHLSHIAGFRTYNISLNGKPITKPYKKSFPISKETSCHIDSIALFEFCDDDDRSIARGWYAMTNVNGSIPADLNIRGIRMRQGNIEIGDESLFSQFFSEKRFAYWHVGEVHISPSILPNARRDGFKLCHRYENFVEHASLLGMHLRKLCANTAQEKRRILTAERKLAGVETSLRDLSFFVDKNHFQTYTQQLTSEIEAAEEALINPGNDHDAVRRLEKCKNKLHDTLVSPRYLSDEIDGRRLHGIDHKQLITEISRQLILMNALGSSPEKVLHDVLNPYLKNKGVAE